MASDGAGLAGDSPFDIRKAVDLVFKGIEAVMALLLVAMVAMVLGNVILRYGFDTGISASEELSRTAFVWLTDFVGWVPMEGPDSREAARTADYNAEMIEQIARFPRVRDRALFVGNPDDVVDLTFGPGLPRIRDWTRAHFEFSGYILPFDPADFAVWR